MGVSSHMLLKELTKAYLESHLELEVFLKSDKALAIFADHDKPEGSLLWAVNISQLFERLNQTPSDHLKKTMDEIFQDNTPNNDMF